MKPIHEKELRELATCAVCDRKIGETGLPFFWKVSAERHGLDAGAISRQIGLTMVLGGNATVAAAMGPDEPMTVPLMESTISVCDSCALERLPELMMEGDEEGPTQTEEPD